MIDLRWLRDNPEAAKASQRARGADESLVDRVIAADEARRTTLASFEAARAEQKDVSRSVGKASPEERPAILERAKALAENVKALESEANTRAEELGNLQYELENIVIEGVPAGGADDFRVIKHVGEVRDFASEGFEPLDHLDLGERLRAIDVKRGAKVSGSRFYYLTGVGARLELALLTSALELAVAHGFTPIITPTLVSPDTMRGTGFLGAHADEVYHLPADDLYLTGTSEVALAGYHADEIIDVSSPLRYAGWSTCYRREAGSHGRDTRGIIRVHQFNKVEMFVFTTQEDSESEHERLLAWEEEMLARAELPYRVIDVAAGDLGSSAARKFDCEAWLPTQQRWMEVTSTSNCTSFQARRLGIRERVEEGGTRPVATLNGTLATTRWMVAMLENHQQPDGSVRVPEALRPFMGGLEVMEPVA
ncbi:MAG: serine--tRNA ligase [bacterium]|nr:serine--tRNA ligase [bacterium]